LYLKTLEILGEEHPSTVTSKRSLISLYEKWGKLEQAERWRAELPHKKSPGE